MRGLTDNPACELCQAVEESNIHVLRDCPNATAIWKELMPTLLHNQFFSSDPQEWLSVNLQSTQNLGSSHLTWSLCYHLLEDMELEKQKDF